MVCPFLNRLAVFLVILSLDFSISALTLHKIVRTQKYAVSIEGYYLLVNLKHFRKKTLCNGLIFPHHIRALNALFETYL